MKRSLDSVLNENPNKKAKIATSLETHGLPKNLSKYLPLNNLSFLRAAEEGDLEMLKFLSIQDDIMHDQDAVRIAAEDRNLEMLKYLIDELGLFQDEDALIAATENEDIEMLKWLVEEKGMVLNIDGLEVHLNEKPNVELVRWAFIKNPCLKINYTDVVSLKTLGYIQKLEFLAYKVSTLFSLTPIEDISCLTETEEDDIFVLEVFQEQVLNKGLPDVEDFNVYKEYLRESGAIIFPGVLEALIALVGELEKSLASGNIFLESTILEPSDSGEAGNDDSTIIALIGED